ncbi:MAG: phospholipid carrier-dependent glycosyltransferase [Myxococcota bacterium]|jgi:hypothetical protein|nr:phospholipid carrier-dependent glycosyltransferase [Myxococcota bacterium]
MSDAPRVNGPQAASGVSRSDGAGPVGRGAIGLALLAAVFVMLCIASARQKAVTVDELGHLPSGVYTLASGDPRHATLNPPLLNVLSALPVFALSLESSIEPPAASDDVFSFWSSGYHFHERHRADYLRIFSAARQVPVLLMVLLGVLVYRWANELARSSGSSEGGPAAGLVAASLFWFSPNLIAHARIVGTDTGTALFIAVAVYALRGMLLRNERWRAVAFGVALGFAQLTKFYALLLYPLALVVVIAWWCWRAPDSPLRSWLVHCAAAFAVSILVLNAGYGFAEFGRSLDSLALHSDTARALQSTGIGSLPLPLPAAFVRAVDGQWLEVTSDIRSFLLGESFQGGRLDYYLIVLLLKTSLFGFVVFAGAAFFGFFRAGFDRAETALLLAFPVLLFLVLSISDNRQLGLRALLAGFPFLCVFMGAAWTTAAGSRRRFVASALVAGALLTGGVAYPDYLAHFNSFAGGGDGGYRVASDANIDIGQDLVGLAAYLDEVDAGTVQLYYFGSVDPALYGIDYRVPEDYRLEPGYVAVSVSLYRMSYDVYDHGVLRKVGPVDLSSLGDPVASIGGSIHVYYRKPATG